MQVENEQQTAKASQVQWHTILLSLVFVTFGLGGFTGLQSRGPNPPSKLLFQPNMANVETLMPPSLANRSLIIQRTLWLPSPNKPTNEAKGP